METSLARLLELSANFGDSAHREEQKELVLGLARELNVSLPDSAPAEENGKEEEHEANGKHHEEPAQENGKHTQASAPTPSPAPAKSQPEPSKAQNRNSVQVKRESVRLSPSTSKPAAAAAGPAGNADCDISSPDIKNAYDLVRDDNSPTNWLLLGYGSSKKALELYGKGEGGLEQFVTKLKEDEVTYGYVRVIYGDSQRSKFVFVTYVPEGLSGMSKAKANMHKPAVTQFLKYMHVEVTASTKGELAMPLIQAKLTAAAGANYGTSTLGGTAPKGSEDYSSIKDQAKSFFMQTEGKGNRQSIVYNKGPLSDTTPVTLTGRAGITEKYIK